MSSGGSWWGECDFLYTGVRLTRKEFLTRVVKERDYWLELCDDMHKEMSSSKPSDGQTSDSGKTVPSKLFFSFIITKFYMCYCSLLI